MSIDKQMLVCIFSYNRPNFLVNLIKSINKFLPGFDYLIVDDGSDDPLVKAVIDTYCQHPRWRAKRMHRDKAQVYGGFYFNMDFALKTAVAEGYRYAFFIEDDQQLVWEKKDYISYLDTLFTNAKDAVQVQPLLFRRMLTYHDTIEYIAESKAYRSVRGFNTTAIWNLNVVRSFGKAEVLHDHGDSLRVNSEYWLKRGYRIYLQFDPTVAILPWVNSMADGIKPSDSECILSDNNKLMLRPLEWGEILFLTTRESKIAPCQEYFRLSTLNIQRPIWHQGRRLLWRYYELCRIVCDAEDRLGVSPAEIQNGQINYPIPVPERRGPQDNFTVIKRSKFRLLLKSKVSSNLIYYYEYLIKFNILDYLGYLRLCIRLHSEQKKIFLMHNKMNINS
jgi:glycosyltransferase involved in cell wall biosynthesis